MVRKDHTLAQPSRERGEVWVKPVTPAGLGQTESSPCFLSDAVALHLLLRVNALSLVALEMALWLDSYYYRPGG